MWVYTFFTVGNFYCVINVLIKNLQTTLSLYTEYESRAEGTLEIIHSKYSFIEEVKPLVFRVHKGRRISVMQSCLCCRGRREPLLTSPPRVFPLYHPFSPVNILRGPRGCEWSPSSYILLPCGHPCALKEEGSCHSTGLSSQSTKMTFTYITNNYSGYHLLRTCARLIA